MATRTIFTKEDELLRLKSKPVTEISKKIIEVLDDMKETMELANGVGLAAPQVGILRRMFIIKLDDEFIEIINPEIIEQSGEQISNEACLSVPGYSGKVKRPVYIKMEGIDRFGNKKVITGEEQLAVVMSHEYDHLDGILYIDKAEEVTDDSEDE